MDFRKLVLAVYTLCSVEGIHNNRVLRIEREPPSHKDAHEKLCRLHLTQF